MKHISTILPQIYDIIFKNTTVSHGKTNFFVSFSNKFQSHTLSQTMAAARTFI